MPEFSEKTLEHIRRPQNVGSISDADVIGEAGDPRTTNYLKMWLKVEGDQIKRITFKAYGCVPALAAGSAATGLAKGKSLGDALKFTPQDILNALGGLPPDREFCAQMAIDTLRNAIGKVNKQKGTRK